MRALGTLRVAIPLASTLLLCACGGDAGRSGAVAETTTTTTSTSAPADAPGDARTTELFFTSGEQFRTVERELPVNGSGGSGGSQLEAATGALIEGPTKRERSADVDVQTQIPAGTELEGVELEQGGTVVVNVSPEFVAGVPEEPGRRSRAQESELDARLGQVTYTLTQFPQVKAAKVVVDGVPVEPQPTLARSDYAKPPQGPKRIERPKGERGSSVRKLQARLAELRYLPQRAVDGVDGYRTQQAVIAFQSWRRLERDGIVGPATRAALAKASAPKPKGDGPARRIEVFREKGVALLIAHGKVKRAIHVSTGAPGTETPAGTYGVFRKELKSWSVPFQTWLPYASYFNNGIAFHEYPDVPTFPASHGCVRVPAPEAKGVYGFAALGTAVVVY